MTEPNSSQWNHGCLLMVNIGYWCLCQTEYVAYDPVSVSDSMPSGNNKLVSVLYGMNWILLRGVHFLDKVTGSGNLETHNSVHMLWDMLFIAEYTGCALFLAIGNLSNHISTLCIAITGTFVYGLPELDVLNRTISHICLFFKCHLIKIKTTCIIVVFRLLFVAHLHHFRAFLRTSSIILDSKLVYALTFFWDVAALIHIWPRWIHVDFCYMIVKLASIYSCIQHLLSWHKIDGALSYSGSSRQATLNLSLIQAFSCVSWLHILNTDNLYRKLRLLRLKRRCEKSRENVRHSGISFKRVSLNKNTNDLIQIPLKLCVMVQWAMI